MWCARLLPQVYRKDTSLCPNNLRFRRQFHFRRVGLSASCPVTNERSEAMHAEKWLNWHTLSLQLCQTVTLAPYIPSDDRNRYNALFPPYQHCRSLFCVMVIFVEFPNWSLFDRSCRGRSSKYMIRNSHYWPPPLTSTPHSHPSLPLATWVVVSK